MTTPVKGENFFYVVMTAFLCVLSLYFAYEIRSLDFVMDEEHALRFREQRLEVMLWLIPLKMVLLYAFGQLDIMAARFRQVDFYKLTLALGLNAVFLLYLWFVFSGQDVPSRGTILVDFMLSLLSISGLRMLVQHLRADAFGIYSTSVNSYRAVIVGAGFVGSNLAFQLLKRPGMGLRPVAFVDDDLRRAGHTIHGLRVEGTRESLKQVVDKYDADKLLLAIPGSPPSVISDIMGRAYNMRIPVKTVPLPEEMVYGQVRAEQLRPVEIDDLIVREHGLRESIETYNMIAGRSVLVTGAGGSIGAEIVRQIAVRNPSRLILLDQSEIQLFELRQRLHLEGFGASAVSLIGSVTDAHRMRHLFERYRPQIIFHAAAHKHVAMMEMQPSEAIKNNVCGTQNLVDLSIQYEVEEFVMISTDKAINPTSVMGASKRLAELVIQSRRQAKPNKTKFISVRFGNVLNSSGSVIPIFKRQIEEGGPVTVTHPDVARYFMTIPEAVGLVLEAAALGGQDGEIYLLDMGKPIKIIDLARQLIELAGFKPDVDIEIKIVGLQPGEKLFEELHYSGESLERTSCPLVLRSREKASLPADFEEILHDMVTRLHDLDRNQLKHEIRRLVPEYTPYLD